MCGFLVQFGTLNQKEALPNFETCKAIFRKRGRDQFGFFSDPCFFGFHARLCIIDQINGRQPMESFDKRHVFVFNGELYNYLELKKQLQRRGIEFQTESDTEVFMLGLIHYGSGFLKNANGMFSFVLYDKKEKSIFVGRDQIGKKPLFYCQLNKKIIISSTVDSIIKIGEMSKKFKPDFIPEFLLTGSTSTKNTPFDKIYRFPCGAYAIAGINKKLKPIKYWNLNFKNQIQKRDQEYEDDFVNILTDSIRIRLRADVKTSLAFSGGVDSGLLAFFLPENADTKLVTIETKNQKKEDSDLDNAKKVANLLNKKLTFIDFNIAEEFLENLGLAYASFDEPTGHPSISYAWSLFKEMKKISTVVLSGNGADELFLGYDSDKRNLWANIISENTGNILPKITSRSLICLFKTNIINQLNKILNSEKLQNQIDSFAEIITKEIESTTPPNLLNLKMLYNLYYNSVDSNFKIPDICGLSAGVEVRSPFLDIRMIEFAAKLPRKMKVRGFGEKTIVKYLPKKIYAKNVGPKIANSIKKGMGRGIPFWPMLISNKKQTDNAFNILFEIGLNKNKFLEKLSEFKIDLQNQVRHPRHGLLINRAFMLGFWLEKNA